MKYFKDKRILITGASSGIGAEFARFFIFCGAKVALFARREDWLEKVAKDFPKDLCLLLPGDVSQKISLENAFQVIEREWHGVDIVIANAGFGVGGFFDALNVEDFRRQFETNFFGVVNTIYAGLPLLEKSSGQLVVISSIAGRVGVPALSVYNSSKFAVCGLCDSIYYEFKDKGVAVTCIQPGIIDSNFSRVDNNNRFSPESEETRPRKIMMPTEKAIKKMAYAVRKKKYAVTITNHAKFLLFLSRFCPALLKIIMTKVSKKRRQS